MCKTSKKITEQDQDEGQPIYYQLLLNNKTSSTSNLNTLRIIVLSSSTYHCFISSQFSRNPDIQSSNSQHHARTEMKNPLVWNKKDPSINIYGIPYKRKWTSNRIQSNIKRSGTGYHYQFIIMSQEAKQFQNMTILTKRGMIPI